MKQHAYHRRNKFDGQFAGRLIAMLESPAFRTLSLSGHRILARIEIELAKHGGNDNGKLPITYEQFAEYGIHKHAIAPAIRECEVLGFLEVTERGQAGNREFRWPSRYRLTYQPVGRARPTNEWQRIQTIEEAELIGRAARKTEPPQKTENHPRKTLDFAPRIRHRKPDFSPPENGGTVPPPDSGGTSRLSGEHLTGEHLTGEHLTGEHLTSSRARKRVASPSRQSAARTHAPSPGANGKHASPLRDKNSR